MHVEGIRLTRVLVLTVLLSLLLLVVMALFPTILGLTISTELRTSYCSNASTYSSAHGRCRNRCRLCKVSTSKSPRVFTSLYRELNSKEAAGTHPANHRADHRTQTSAGRKANSTSSSGPL